MDKILEKCLDALDKGNMKNIYTMALVTFSLIFPSYLLLFLYKRELFLQLDFMKLIFLGIGINGFVMISTHILYTIIYTEDYIKDLKRISKELENNLSAFENQRSSNASSKEDLIKIKIKNRCEKECKDIIRKKEKNILVMTICNMIVITLTIIYIYMLDFWGNKTISFKEALIRIGVCCLMFNSRFIIRFLILAIRVLVKDIRREIRKGINYVCKLKA